MSWGWEFPLEHFFPRRFFSEEQDTSKSIEQNHINSMEVEQYKYVMKKLNNLLKKTRIRAREMRRKSFLSEALRRRKIEIMSRSRKEDRSTKNSTRVDKHKGKILIRSNGFKVNRQRPSMKSLFSLKDRNIASTLLRRKIDLFKRRDLKVSSREDKRFDVNCHMKRAITIEGCKNCVAVLGGACTSISIVNCKKVTILCTGSLIIKSGRLSVLGCESITMDLVSTDIPIITVEKSKKCFLRLGNPFKSRKRVLTSRSSEISVRVSETWYAVPSNRPSEKSFLITHVNDDGKVLSEMSVQHGLLVIPKSEFEALQKRQRKT